MAYLARGLTCARQSTQSACEGTATRRKSSMQHAANVTSGDVLDWHAIEWKRVYRTVKNLRQRIFRASREGDLRRVRSLQRLMLRCTANILESVRRVTQGNQGKM